MDTKHSVTILKGVRNLDRSVYLYSIWYMIIIKFICE